MQNHQKRGEDLCYLQKKSKAQTKTRINEYLNI